MALTGTFTPTRSATSRSNSSNWTLSSQSLRYSLPLPVQTRSAQAAATLFGLRVKASRFLKLSVGAVIGALGIIATWWALDLAMWTAAKEYWDHCAEQKQLTSKTSPKCAEVLEKELSEPPTWRSYFRKIPDLLGPQYRSRERRDIFYHAEDAGPDIDGPPDESWMRMSWEEIGVSGKLRLFQHAASYKLAGLKISFIMGLSDDIDPSDYSWGDVVPPDIDRWEDETYIQYCYNVRRCYDQYDDDDFDESRADKLNDFCDRKGIVVEYNKEYPGDEVKEQWSLPEIIFDDDYDELDEDSADMRRVPREHLASKSPLRPTHDRMIADLLSRAEHTECDGRHCADERELAWYDEAYEGVRKQGGAAIMYGGMGMWTRGCGYRYNYTYTYSDFHIHGPGRERQIPSGMVWSRINPVNEESRCWVVDLQDDLREIRGLEGLWDMFAERSYGAEVDDWEDWARRLDWRYGDRVGAMYNACGSVESIRIEINQTKEAGWERGSPRALRTGYKHVHIGLGGLSLFDGPDWLFWENVWTWCLITIFSLTLVWVDYKVGGKERRRLRRGEESKGKYTKQVEFAEEAKRKKNHGEKSKGERFKQKLKEGKLKQS